MKHCLVGCTAVLLLATSHAAEQDRNPLEGVWKIAGESKGGEATLRFSKGRLVWSGSTTASKDGIRTVATSSRQYDLEVIEKDKMKFLALKAAFRKEKLESTVAFHFDGATLVLKGRSPDGIDLTGKWIASKKKDTPAKDK